MVHQALIPHPLDDLDEVEIEISARVIKASFPPNAEIDFRSSSLYEPERQEAAAFLAKEHGGQAQETITPRPAREARITYYLKATVSSCIIRDMSIHMLIPVSYSVSSL